MWGFCCKVLHKLAFVDPLKPSKLRFLDGQGVFSFRNTASSFFSDSDFRVSKFVNVAELSHNICLYPAVGSLTTGVLKPYVI